MIDNNTIHIGQCPTCTQMVQVIDNDGTPEYRRVERLQDERLQELESENRVLRSDYNAWRREAKHWMEFVDRTAKELGIPAGLASWEFIEQVCIVADERDRLRAALEAITNPLKYLQERAEAEAEGAALDGVAATYVADSPEFLKGIARDALAEGI